MGKKSGPPAPDYTAAAEKTAESQNNQVLQQTWANRANQVNPWGTQSWQSSAAVDPATGKPVTQWTQTTTLDPRLQHALDSQIALQSGRSDLANSLFPRAQEEFGQAMDWSKIGTDWASAPQATTSAFGFGPQQPNIDQSRQSAPQLNTTNPATGMGDIQRAYNFGGAQDVQGAAEARQSAEDAIYKSAASRLDPQWAQRQHDLENDLANKGISVNSEAYTRAMDDFNRGKTDAYAQAQMAAITGGGAEAQRQQGMNLGLRQQQINEAIQQGQFGNAAQQQAFQQGLAGSQAQNAALSGQFGLEAQARAQQMQAQQGAFQMGMQGAQFGLGQQQQAFAQQQAAAQFQNQMRQQQIAEAMQQRGFSLNEINAIISGQQVSAPQFSGYNSASLGQGVDYSGASNSQFQAGMAKQQMANDSMSSMMSGIGSIAGAAMMFSDRRVKRDIRRIGRHPRGFGIYRYRYVGESLPRVGVIAQDVRRYAPELVRNLGGVLAVDYSRI